MFIIKCLFDDFFYCQTLLFQLKKKKNVIGKMSAKKATDYYVTDHFSDKNKQTKNPQKNP